MARKSVSISTEYITLGQLLKLADFIDSGGQAKHFLAQETVIINGQQDQRRGRKLVPGDMIEVKGIGRCEVRAKSIAATSEGKEERS